MKKINLNIQKFAISPSSTTATMGAFYIKTEYAEPTIDEENNISSFYLRLFFYPKNSAVPMKGSDRQLHGNGFVAYLTEDTVWEANKTYYKRVGNNVSALSSGSNYTIGENIPTDWIVYDYYDNFSFSETYLTTAAIGGCFNLQKMKLIAIKEISISSVPHKKDGTRNMEVYINIPYSTNTWIALCSGVTITIPDGEINDSVVLDEINRRSTLNSVANFTLDDSYTAISYNKFEDSGAVDYLTIKVPNQEAKILPDSIWKDASNQINLITPIESLGNQSIINYVAPHVDGQTSPQIAFTLSSSLNGKAEITTAFAYVSQAYIFSKYKLTEDTEYQAEKIYYHKEPEYYFTGDSVYLDGIQYFKLQSGQFIELIPGTDYQIGASIPANTIYERRWVYNKLIQKVYDPETQSWVGDYSPGDPIDNPSDEIYERDDKYNICKHTLHNKEEGKYRIAINGLADPTGPPLQVFNGYQTDDKEDLFFYRPGDKVTVTGYVTGGLISGSSSTIRWTIILPKRLDYVEAPILRTENTTVDKFKIFCRDVNSKYIWACGGTGNKYRGGIRGTKSSSAAWTIEFLKYPSSGPCNKIRMSVTRDEDHPWKEYDSSKAQTGNTGEGAGGTVPNNTPIAVEVSSLILEFPR